MTREEYSGARSDTPAVAGVRDDLTAQDLADLLPAALGPGPVCHWTARPDTLGPIVAGPPPDLSGWSEGRAWSARAEVRWQRLDANRYSALYLGTGEAVPDGFRPIGGPLHAVPGDDEGLLLWGRRADDGHYRDPRLPRALDYPGVATEEPEARIPYQLLTAGDGQVRFVRLTLAAAAE